MTFEEKKDARHKTVIDFADTARRNRKPMATVDQQTPRRRFLSGLGECPCLDIFGAVAFAAAFALVLWLAQ